MPGIWSHIRFSHLRCTMELSTHNWSDNWFGTFLPGQFMDILFISWQSWRIYWSNLWHDWHAHSVDIVCLTSNATLYNLHGWKVYTDSPQNCTTSNILEIWGFYSSRTMSHRHPCFMVIVCLRSNMILCDFHNHCGSTCTHNKVLRNFQCLGCNRNC